MADIELELTCNICLDLLTEPHQYPCGHSFCLQCIDQLWNRQSFNCPDCRRTCPDRREIVRNFRLQNIVEAYRQNGNTLNIPQPLTAGVQPGRQDYYGTLLVIVLLLFISVFSLLRLQNTDQIHQDSQSLSDSSQPEHADQCQAADPPGLLFLLLAPLRWLWLLVECVFMCVWWLISSLLWLVYQCVWLVFELVRLVFVSIWELFCLVCGLLIQSFNIAVYICGVASITVFITSVLMFRND